MTETAREIIPINLEDEMRRSYLDYAMSVIIGRALPDARDGLKPVHRRALYAMHELGAHSNKPYYKSARIVGDVIGKYHPHGDTAVYDTVVRMAQPFSLRYMLVDGQGNMAKPKPSVAGLARNQLVSSTLTNKSRNSSTFSSNEEHSRATSISSCIPQTEPEPHIVKPRIATYCWQEENTNCYQVRINKILVSRREDNNYINCTKLLNVTKMTRGKRDGILKTEKVKDVVKVGTMNLKGVWIPFDRAYEIARNEGIDELLHPLFVRNIKEYFLTGGHKLKSEEEDAEEIENLRTTKIEGKSNLEVLDESNSSYNKSASCPTGEYATSLSSNDSN